MKKINTNNVITKCIASAALLFSLSTSYAQIPSTNLKAYWPLDGNALDLSGNNNNGTVTGATLTTDRFGKANSAYQFNGTSQYITIPANSTTNLSKPFSISIWCYNNGGSQTLFRKGGEWGIDLSGSSTVGQPNQIAFFAQTASQSVDVFYTNTTFPVNTWVNIVAVFNNTASNNVSIYVNNALVLTGTGLTNNFTTTNNITIGAYNSNSPNPEAYNGKVDDIRIYSKALSTSEITSLYNEQKPVSNVTFRDNYPADGLRYCSGSYYTTSDITVSGVFNAGNIISVQLIKPDGSLYSTQNVGYNYASAASNPIAIHIPSGVPSGAGYRFKIKTTNPASEYIPSQTFEIYNLAAPVISNTTPTSICSGTAVTLNSSSTFGNKVYEWRRDNSTAGGYNNWQYPTNYNATTSGKYTAVYADQNGCTKISNAVDVVVSAINKPVITRTGNASNCQGYVRTFTTTAVAGESLQWYVNGNAVQSATTNTLSVAAYGFNNGVNTVTVKATNTIGCSVTSDPFTININPNPSAPTITSDFSPICSFPVTLTTNYPNVFWSTGTSGKDISVNTSGNYQAFYKDPTTGCNSSLTVFSVAPLPTIAITGEQLICPGASTSLNASANFTSYSWSTGETTQNIVAPAGNYTVTGTNAIGCSASASISVASKNPSSTLPCNFTTDKLNMAVNASLPSGFNASEIVSYKFKLYSLSGELLGEKTQASSSIVLQDLPGIEFNKTFNWTVQVQYTCGGTSQWGPESNPCPLNILAPNVQVECGLYFESLYNSSMVLNFPTTNSSLVSNYVFTFYGPTQTITYTSSSPVINFNAVPNLYINNDYEWTVQARYKTNGTFTLSPMNTPCTISFWDPSFIDGRLTNNSNTNESTEASLKIKGCCLDSERIEKHTFKIYPNPSNGGNATIDFENENTSSNIIVKDVTGREILHFENVNEKMIHINTSHIEKGIYVVLVEIEGELLTERLIIE